MSNRDRFAEAVARTARRERIPKNISLNMEIIGNINRLLGDSLKETIVPGVRLKIAASCFPIDAFEALNAELEKIEKLHFIFTLQRPRAENKFNRKVELNAALRRLGEELALYHP